MKPGTLVVLRVDRLLSHESSMPLWATSSLMNAAMAGDTFEVNEVTGWMTGSDTALVVEVDRAPAWTRTVRVHISREDGGSGWISSTYLREIKSG